MTAKLLLLINNPAAQNTYKALADANNISVTCVSSFEAIRQALTEDRYNGLLIDMKSKLRLPQEDRDAIQKVIEQYPTAQLQFSATTNKVSPLFLGKARGAKTLEHFFTTVCPQFIARSIRMDSRVSIHLNVLLTSEGQAPNDLNSKTVTLNVSKSGAFIYSIKPWDTGERVLLDIKELKAETPISAKICRVVPWGVKTQMPGIGVAFDQPAPLQLEEFIDTD